MIDIYRILLKQGFTKNDIRKGNLNYADFGGLSFFDRNFTGLDISKVNLMGANFSNMNLNRCSFLGANFFRTNFGNADFSHVDFSHSNFSETDFRGACFVNTSFHAALFRQTKFKDVSFQHACFINVFMPETDFSGGAFVDANFAFADFRGANMIGIVTESLSIASSSFHGTDFNDVLVSRNSKIVLYKAISGSYEYQTFAFRLSSGAELIRLGCFCRPVKSWNRHFWNNNSEFDPDMNLFANRQRLFAYKILIKWLQDE